jgi:hypothetical protein
LKAFTLLFISICKMWVRISLKRTGLSGSSAVKLARYMQSKYQMLLINKA